MAWHQNQTQHRLKSIVNSFFIKPAFTDFLTSVFNSSNEPMHISFFPSFDFHIGRGVPQKRERERFQSTKFSSQLPKRPVPVDAGFQLMFLFNSIILSFRAVVLI